MASPYQVPFLAAASRPRVRGHAAYPTEAYKRTFSYARLVFRSHLVYIPESVVRINPIRSGMTCAGTPRHADARPADRAAVSRSRQTWWPYPRVLYEAVSSGGGRLDTYTLRDEPDASLAVCHAGKENGG